MLINFLTVLGVLGLGPAGVTVPSSVAITLPIMASFGVVWNESDYAKQLKPGSQMFFATFIGVGCVYCVAYAITEALLYHPKNAADDTVDDPNVPAVQAEVLAMYFIRFIVVDIVSYCVVIWRCNKDASPHAKRLYMTVMGSFFLQKVCICISAAAAGWYLFFAIYAGGLMIGIPLVVFFLNAHKDREDFKHAYACTPPRCVLPRVSLALLCDL